MKRELWTWAMLGGLLASTWLNVELMVKLETVPAPATTPAATPEGTTPPIPLPEHVVTSLGLSREQCLMIEGCSRN